MKLQRITWENFHSLPPVEKAKYLNEEGKPYHVLIAQQFDRNMLDSICELATRIRLIAKSKTGMDFLKTTLSHKRAMLYFTQPSTRTFLSFSAACQILGMTINEVRDPVTSSEFKGESKEDSVRTFSSYFDLIIMRSAESGLAERMAWVLSNTERPVPVINAGSGKDQHPTQALLDIYTLQRSFENYGGIDNKTVVFVGDLARGRTVRSLSWLLTNYYGVKQIFVAPPGFQIGEDILKMLEEKRCMYELKDDFRKVLPEADAIYMTRIQDEWDVDKESKTIDLKKYSLHVEDLKLLKPNAIIMHPFPRRTEIPPEIDSSPHAVYWRQMRNGMWIRCALISSMFGRERIISSYYIENL